MCRRVCFNGGLSSLVYYIRMRGGWDGRGAVSVQGSIYIYINMRQAGGGGMGGGEWWWGGGWSHYLSCVCKVRADGFGLPGRGGVISREASP